MSPLASRSFGSSDHDQQPTVPAAGRPRLPEPPQRIALYLPSWLVEAYDEEARKRYPGSTRKRNEVMSNVLLDWLFVRSAARYSKEELDHHEATTGS